MIPDLTTWDTNPIVDPNLDGRVAEIFCDKFFENTKDSGSLKHSVCAEREWPGILNVKEWDFMNVEWKINVALLMLAVKIVDLIMASQTDFIRSFDLRISKFNGTLYASVFS